MTSKNSSDKEQTAEDREQEGGGGNIPFGRVGGPLSGPPGGGQAESEDSKKTSRKTAGKVGGPISGAGGGGKSRSKK